MQRTWLTLWKQYLTESRIALNEGPIVIGGLFTLTPSDGNVYIRNNKTKKHYTYQVLGKSSFGYVRVAVKDFPSNSSIEVRVPVVGTDTYKFDPKVLLGLLNTKFGSDDIYMTTKEGSKIKFELV